MLNLQSFSTTDIFIRTSKKNEYEVLWCEPTVEISFLIRGGRQSHLLAWMHTTTTAAQWLSLSVKVLMLSQQCGVADKDALNTAQNKGHGFHLDDVAHLCQMFWIFNGRNRILFKMEISYLIKKQKKKWSHSNIMQEILKYFSLWASRKLAAVVLFSMSLIIHSALIIFHYFPPSAAAKPLD